MRLDVDSVSSSLNRNSNNNTTQMSQNYEEIKQVVLAMLRGTV